MRSLNPISYKLKSSRGQALIEVMVAVSVLVVGFMGVVSLLSRALALNRVVAENYTATYLAAEGIEVAKSIIDGNLLQGKAWNTGNNASGCAPPSGCEVDHESLAFTSFAARPLFYDPSRNLYGYSGSERTSYTRRVTITLLNQNQVQVNSEITWTARGGGTSRVDLEDYFFNWRP